MADTTTVAELEVDLETARGIFASAQLNPEVDEGTKLLAAAIVQAGTEIALAIANGESMSD
jgi:hypothetical protein